MRYLVRLALFYQALRADIVEVALKAVGRDVRRETAAAATGDPGVIVDLFTGVGGVLPYYARRFPEAHIIGVDLNERLLGLVKKRLVEETGYELELLAADARELPLPAGSVDLVNISFGLHELKKMDRYLVLGESYRVLKDGGQLVVADYREARGFFRRLAARTYFALFEPGWVRELFYGGLQSQINDAGFSIEKVRQDLPMTRMFLAVK